MASRKTIYQEGGASFRLRPVLGVGFLAFSSYSRQHGGLGLAAHNSSGAGGRLEWRGGIAVDFRRRGLFEVGTDGTAGREQRGQGSNAYTQG